MERVPVVVGRGEGGEKEGGSERVFEKEETKGARYGASDLACLHHT
jgi:hypothetical protein